MKNKLKELSKYCCKPNKQEYEFIKTCARLGGVEVYDGFKFKDGETCYVMVSQPSRNKLHLAHNDTALRYSELIPVTQFCDILLKDEKEFEWKPKVGEWVVWEWSDNVNVFFIERQDGTSLIVSKYIKNGKKMNQDMVQVASDHATFRQPTPEEIQTAIDAWDDRVEFSLGISYCLSNDNKTITARDGYKFRLSEDCLTVELIKSEQ